MDRYLKEIIKNLEIKENYIDNEGSYIEYIETKELNKIFNNVVSKQKVNDEIETLRKMLKATMEGKLQKYTPNEIIIKTNTLEELLEDK